MGNEIEGQIQPSTTNDTDFAIHPNLNAEETNNTEEHERSTSSRNTSDLPVPPPPLSLISPLSANFLPSTPKVGRPVGLTVDIDHSGSPITKGSRSMLPQNSPGAGTMMPVEVDLEIQEGSDAAKALRANADVKVTKVGKAARFLHVQAVRRNAKKIFHVGTASKRGKPPRIPGMTSDVRDMVLNGTHEQIDKYMRETGNNLDILLEDFDEEEEEDDMLNIEIDVSEKEFQSPILMSKSSDSSDADVPTKVAVYEHQSSLMLLDTKGKKQEVILNRKMKRKMKKREKKKAKRNYVKGKVIDGKHELYTLSIAMMLGLRYSIFLTNNQILEDRKNGRMWLDSDEFMKVEKYIFRPDGGQNTPPHQLSHTFKFKDYSPLPFAFIRRMFGINEYEFHHSVCGNANFIEFISNAKSGQFFFYSSDGKFMIKTMTNSESKFLRRILPHYFRHCSQNPNTILTKFLGMYRVKLYHLRKNVKFVIMNSVFDTDKILSSFYDLKGSVVGRDAKVGESVLKDNDLRKSLVQSAIRLPEQVRERMREQVRRDCNFLKEMKIMDYSMLVGIHYIPTKNSKKPDISGLAFRGGRKPKKLERARSVPSAAMMSPVSISPNIFQRCITSERMHNRSHLDAFTVLMESSPMSMTEKKIEFSRSSSDALELKSPDDDSAISSHQYKQSSPNADDFKQSLVSEIPPIPNLSIAEGESIVSTTSFGYDEEDDCSLLEGPRHPRHLKPSLNVSKPDDLLVKERERIDKRREQAIEQNYWPFHRHYELNGDRRIVPMKAKSADIGPEDIEGENNVNNAVCTSCFGDPADYDPDLKALRENMTLDEFTAPITGRKDGGLLMELSDVTLPLKATAGGKSLNCDGKIYYIGIIDILQQFNVRKRLEARLRKIQGGERGASCVHPEVYAERFVNFFDEYTQGIIAQNITQDEDGAEEIVFEDSSRPTLD